MQLHADWAVTMACGDACPTCPPRSRTGTIADPAGQPIEEVRSIRDEIEVRVRDLIEGRLARYPLRPHRSSAAAEPLLPDLAREFEG